MDRIVECQRQCWPDYPPELMYDRRLYELQLDAFPEGQLLAESRGEVVGYATSLVVQLEELPYAYDYNEITGSGTFSTHRREGDTLYGADIGVLPQWRGQGIAQKLYAGRRKLLKRLNLRRMLAYGRLPGFAQHAGELTAQEYVEAVAARTLVDPALTAHLKAGYEVIGVSLELMRDALSLDWATRLEYPNPDFDPARRRVSVAPLRRGPRAMRVCAGQYLMRPLAEWSELERSIDFFAQVAEEYHGHLLVLPELFVATMMPKAEGKDDRTRMRSIAEKVPALLDYVSELAVRHNLFIVSGTMPVMREGSLYNVAHLHSPSGGTFTQDKLHLTPGERESWGMRPGRGLKVFETRFGRLAILVCYDIEFPELARAVALAGADVICVPFSTDERKAYQRVRFTAQARAVENSLFVVAAGNAGNLPARSYLLNYARSAVFTPSDFGFPDTAVIAEADPNVETVVVADLDFASLALHRQHGTVRPLADRRTDIYSLELRSPVELVHVE